MVINIQRRTSRRISVIKTLNSSMQSQSRDCHSKGVDYLQSIRVIKKPTIVLHLQSPRIGGGIEEQRNFGDQMLWQSAFNIVLKHTMHQVMGKVTWCERVLGNSMMMFVSRVVASPVLMLFGRRPNHSRDRCWMSKSRHPNSHISGLYTTYREQISPTCESPWSGCQIHPYVGYRLVTFVPQLC